MSLGVFTGFIAESEKADHYRLADVFVMPSRKEGFGTVLLEALACGVPVIASALDGSREAVKNGELGIVVNPRSPQQIKTGILHALERKSVPPTLNDFSYGRFADRVGTILKHWLSVRGGAAPIEKLAG